MPNHRDGYFCADRVPAGLICLCTRSIWLIWLFVLLSDLDHCLSYGSVARQITDYIISRIKRSGFTPLTERRVIALISYIIISQCFIQEIWRYKKTHSFCLCKIYRSDNIAVSTRHRPKVGPMLGQRRRRWTSIGQTLRRCLVFAGIRSI